MRHSLISAASLAVVSLVLAAGAAAGNPSVRWYPAGYILYPKNSNIAGRWDWKPHCAYGASCEGLYLVTRYGCPNGLYAEMNVVLRGVVVDYTNDSAGSVRPRQIARLTFNVYNLPSGAKAELTKVHCY